jgi:flagellar hook-length control protein FliK
MTPLLSPGLDRQVEGAATKRASADAAGVAALWSSLAEAGRSEAGSEVAGTLEKAPARASVDAPARASVDAPAGGDTALAVRPEIGPPIIPSVTAGNGSQGSAPFDLPAFLRVLPKAGNAVAVAAGRDPAIADALRRLPATPVADSRLVSTQRLSAQQGSPLRLPSFLAGFGRENASSGQPTSEPVAVAQSAVASNAAEAPLSGAGEVGAALQALAVGRPVADRAAALRGDATSVSERGRGPESPAPSRAASGITPSAASAMLAVPAGEPGSPSRTAAARRADPLQALAATPPAAPASNGAPFVPPPHATQWAATASAALGGAGAGDPFPSFGITDRSGMAAPMAGGSAPVETGALLLREPVGTEAWQEGLGAQVVMMANADGDTEAVMKLAPEELGEIEIRVVVRDGEAALQFGAANAEARQAIEIAQPRLRELLASQGMGVSSFSVFSSLDGNHQSFSRNGEQRPHTPQPVSNGQGELQVRVHARDPQGIVDLYA